jgi:uncharacterized protein YjhX (UPF0386 family)
MKEEHKKIIEEIMFKFKNTKDGLMYRESFVELFNNDSALMVVIVNIILKDLNLIDSLNGNAYRLTQNGWDFTSFSEIEIKKKNSENIQSEIERLTLKKLKYEQLPAKFWWLIIIIMAFVSILTTWVNNQISKLENQQEPKKTEILLPKQEVLKYI